MTKPNLAAIVLICNFVLPSASATANADAPTDTMGKPFLQHEIAQINALLADPETDWQPITGRLLDGVVSFERLAQRTFEDYLEETLEKYEDNLKKSEYRQLLGRYQARLIRTFRQRIITDLIAQLHSANVRRLVLGEFDIGKGKGHVDLRAQTANAPLNLRAHLQHVGDQWKVVDLSLDGDLISQSFYEMCEDIIDKEHFLPVLEARLKREDHIVLEDFSITEPGNFPRDWWGWRLKEKKKDSAVLEQIYRVEKKNEPTHTDLSPTPDRIYHSQVELQADPYYLAAKDRDHSIIIIKSAPWNPRQYPIMTWCWRVDALPPGGDERYGPTNDSAAGLYVMFSQNWLGVPKQIKYVWSSTLAEGTVGRRKRIWRPWFVVAESGDRNLGKWTFEQVDLYRDFGRTYEGKPDKQTVGLGILTDANSTDSYSEAYYADIRVWTREAQEKGLIKNHCGSLNNAISAKH